MEHSLNKARADFPRLSFVSDSDLKAHMDEPLNQAVNNICRKVFNATAFDFDKDSGDIVGFFGDGSDSKDQSFKFAAPVKGTDLATTLVNLNVAIKDKVMADIHAQMSQMSPDELCVDVKPVGVAEAVTIADELLYCMWVEKAMLKGGLYDMLDTMSEVVKKLIDHVNVEKNHAQKMIHSSRINIALVWKRNIARLIKSCCRRCIDQPWKSFSKFYFDGSVVTMKIGDATFNHGYEYQGTVELLGVTLFTEQLNSAYGEALASNKAHACMGATGLGKTETVKDFAKKLGRWVHVTSCYESHKSSDLMKLVQVDNTWVVFEEINRLEPVELDSFMKDLAAHLAAHADAENGVFTAFQNGYAGRSKVDFDPKNWLSNMADTPDFVDIRQLRLATEGFHKYEELGYKIAKIMYEFMWQMSRTDHYDFVAARKIDKLIGNAGKWRSKCDSEESALNSAIMVSFYPTFKDEDLQTFDKIMNKVGFNPADFVWAKNEKAVHPTMEQDKFESKCAMFAEIAEQRHAIQVIGFDHGYVEAIAQANDYHVVTVDIGKAQPEGFAMDHRYHKDALDRATAKGSVRDWLFGFNDPSTGAWREGEFTKAFKEVVSGETSKKDGLKLLHLKAFSFDYTMLDQLNSLMDNNKRYETENGFRGKLPMDVRIVLESTGCMVQSPAHLARTGVLFITFK